MPEILDTSALLSEIIGALHNELQDGLSDVATLAEDQGRRIAALAAMIAESRINGTLRTNDHLFEVFTRQLEFAIETLAQALAGRTALTVERAWNAVVGVVWNAVNQVLGAAGLGALTPAVLPLVPL